MTWLTWQISSRSMTQCNSIYRLHTTTRREHWTMWKQPTNYKVKPSVTWNCVTLIAATRETVLYVCLSVCNCRYIRLWIWYCWEQQLTLYTLSKIKHVKTMFWEITRQINYVIVFPKRGCKFSLHPIDNNGLYCIVEWWRLEREGVQVPILSLSIYILLAFVIEITSGKGWKDCESAKLKPLRFSDRGQHACWHI